MVSLHFMGPYSKSAVRAVYTRPAVRAAFGGLLRALLCMRPLADCYVPLLCVRPLADCYAPCCACGLWRIATFPCRACGFCNIATFPAVHAAFAGLLRSLLCVRLLADCCVPL
ncbi:MAG: hypothetical protein RSA55_09045 [Clostridia bacterium]